MFFRRTFLAFACAAMLCSPAFAKAAALPILHPINPCAILRPNDVFRLNGWTITSITHKRYAILGDTGKMCFLESSQGVIVVTVPDYGLGFPGLSVFNDPQAADYTRQIHGYPADVEIYNQTVYVTKHKQSLSVRVAPDEGMATYYDLEPFVKVIVKRMP
ncbi:MAG: hypothetical protein ACREM8_01790 [Vulcanimicrobiaceae bacterium]